jgi:hypothetical protein
MQSGKQIAGWPVLAGVLLAVMIPVEVLAQARPSPPRAPRTTAPSSVQPARQTPPGLLTADEGLAVLGAALASRYKVEAHSDCSHLVHAIYENAGFSYSYESSSDLYAGDSSFRRVARPQPGDVVVWPGHAGIVVSPAQKTFFSALRSGLGVQAYDSVYWRGRGQARFLRYLKATPGQVWVASKRTPTLEPAGLRSSGAQGPIVTEVEDPEDTDAAEESGIPLNAPAVLAAVPSMVVVSGTQPKAEQVQAALLVEFGEASSAVQAQDVFKLHTELVAFERLEVRKVHLRRDSSWIEVRLREPVPVTAPAGHAKKHAELQRWTLRRQGTGSWELELPADAIYLPREDAVRILAHQLAGLTEGNSDAQEQVSQKAQLARSLAALLRESPSR